VQKNISFISLTFIAFILSGCMVNKNREPITLYTPPNTSIHTATIIGSTELSKSIKADKIAYVFAVDYEKIENGREKMNSPLVVNSGEHDLQLWCQQGGYKYTNLTRVKLEAGKRYQVQFSMNVDRQYNCYVWIYDLDTKKAIGELVSTIEVGEYAKPNKMRPIRHVLKPRPQATNSYTVPIRVINKMGHN
jgi:hypothetical protein